MTILLSDPLKLPCGATLPNRLAKAAMIEGAATTDGVPTPEMERLYRNWSDGGAGLLISGVISIDPRHILFPGDVIIDGPSVAKNDVIMTALTQWAKAATRNGNHFWAQIGHGGRQTRSDVNQHPKAPSAVKLGLPGGRYGEPEALTVQEIEELVDRFAVAAKICQSAGFTGAQIHSAHGYLLSSFLSPIFNQRKDEYGGSLENRARFLLAIVKKMREKVGPNFPISVKLNSADFQKGGFNFQDSLQVVQWLEEASVDLLEISGGNYEQPALWASKGRTEEWEEQNVAPSTRAREAYFVEFAKAMQDVVKVPLMVTGGFRTKAAMISALDTGAADVIGLGRPMCVMTDAPKQLLGGLEALPRYEDGTHLIPDWLGFLRRFQLLKVVDLFASIYWFYEQLKNISLTGKADPNLGVFKAFIAVEVRHHKMLVARNKALADAGDQD